MRNADPTMRWPVADGPAAALIRNLRADASPLGPSQRWPPALRRTIDLILPSLAQMAVFWRPECVAFYNDAYAGTLGNKHPAAMGRPAGDPSPELWPTLQATFESVRQSGKAIGARDCPFVINRSGKEETLFFDFCWSPVRGDGGEVDGVLCIVTETTEHVRAMRALAASERQAREDCERLRQSEARFRALAQGDPVSAAPGGSPRPGESPRR
jgi:PAS domain-containing protein